MGGIFRCTQAITPEPDVPLAVLQQRPHLAGNPFVGGVLDRWSGYEERLEALAIEPEGAIVGAGPKRACAVHEQDATRSMQPFVLLEGGEGAATKARGAIM
jgi:hypothetical protein